MNPSYPSFAHSCQLLNRFLRCRGLLSSSQRRNLLFQSTPTPNSKRQLSSLCELQSRAVVQLSGKDTINFLQGLVSNDVNRLVEKTPSTQYCMMLNVQGRVLYDLFLYNISCKDDTTVLIDVDKSGKDELMRILKRYKLRKKISIDDVSSELSTWYQFNTSVTQESDDSPVSYHDPRVPQLGCRFVKNRDFKDEISINELTPEDVYAAWRYRWGIPEGISDLPPGNCLPLESNLSLMNGVDFHKGCYVGQELTARTYHTGVIRKRLVPIQLDDDAEVEPDSTILTKAKGKNAGKFRNAIGKDGLALLRLAHLQDELVITAKDGRQINVTASVPDWWPSGLV